ncbi:hypothetical protein QBC44DRAFT_314722 [Cladorrhinum sp. PSN332]|nr:hypothetical protein QBC44DRAFT_314722 [Cladorrhinum sp. PSN332]
MVATTPFSTPKRKRDEMTVDHVIPDRNSLSQFTFELDYTVSDGSVSPRTSVAHRFQGLALEGGGGVTRYRNGGGASPLLSPNNLMMISMDLGIDDGTQQRKRARLPDFNMLAAAGPAAAIRAEGSAEPTPLSLDNHSTTAFSQTEKPKKASRPSARPQISPKLRFDLDPAIIEQSETIANTHETNETTGVRSSANDNDTSAGAATSTLTSVEGDTSNELPTDAALRQKSPSTTSKPRTKRAGTPPPPKPASSSKAKSSEAVVDPLRASLTWHDDEITIYDPDDSDDDGTGINGIGFKPTPAIAYARTVKRKQQLAEYKKREEREARARRSQRRGAGTASGRVSSPARSSAGDLSKGGTSKNAKVERRRVRFLESVVKEAIGV